MEGINKLLEYLGPNRDIRINDSTLMNLLELNVTNNIGIEPMAILRYYLENSMNCNLLELLETLFKDKDCSKNANFIRLILDKKMDNNFFDGKGNLLHYIFENVSLYGNSINNLIKSIHFLLGCGIDVNKRDNKNRHILHHLIKINDDALFLHIINIFLECSEIDINCIDKNENTVLHLLLIEDKIKNFEALLPLFLNKGFNINYINNKGNTILHELFHRYKDCHEKLDFMFNFGIDVNLKNNFGKTILHYAVCNFDIKSTKKLLEYGAEINALTNRKNTVLHLCLINYYSDDTIVLEEIMELLLKHRANPNIKNKGNKLPLHLCEKKKISKNVIKLLLYYGADLESEDIYESMSKNLSKIVLECLHEREKNALKREIENLRKENRELKYAPENPGYLDAMLDFNKLANKKNEKK